MRPPATARRPAPVRSAQAAACALLAGAVLSGSQTAGRVALPVERASNVFFARATVNDVGPLWFTVDTGATLTVIDPEVARRVGLDVTPAGRGQVGVGGEPVDLSTARGVRIGIAGLRVFSPPAVYVVPVRANAGYLRHHIDGVLGTDFLRRYAVEFDYRSSTVTLRTAAPGDPPPPDDAVRFTLAGNLLVALADLTMPDGSALRARVLVDTGSNGALTLTSPFVRRHQLVERFPSTQLSLSVGIDGVTSAPVVALTALTLGTATLRQPLATLSKTTTGLNASEDIDGIIGAELLRGFTLTVDYPRGRLVLR